MNAFCSLDKSVTMSDEKPKELKKEPANGTVAHASCSWWSPWIEAAKLKSCEVLEFVKNDLTEISTVVKSEATSVINTTTNVIKDTFKSKRSVKELKRLSSKCFARIKEKYSELICPGSLFKRYTNQLEEPNSKANSVKKSVSSFLGTVSNVLSPMPDDEDQEAIVIKNDGPVTLSPLQVKIHNLIKNQDTFLLEIEESLLPQYKSWLEIIDDQLSTEKLTKQLVASPELHNQYEALVPQHVTHITFWKRFLFRKALLEDEESRREMRERKEKQQVEQVQWEKEDFAQNIEISEEEQIRLLSEYEKEKKKSLPPENKPKKSGKELESSSVDDLKMSLKKDLIIVGDTGSSQMSTSSGDTEGKDTGDDWEKDFELEDAEVEALTEVK